MHDVDVSVQLRRRGWLSRTPSDFQEALLSLCRTRRFNAGDVLFSAGDDGGGIFGIHSGSIGVSNPSANAEMRLIDFLQPGAWFGAAPLFNGESRHVSAQARTDVVILQALFTDLRPLLAHQPEWWRWMGCMVLDLQERAIGAADDLLIRDHERRCIATILRLCGCRFEDPEPDVLITASVTHEELATMANLARNTVGEMLHRLADDGLVELGYRTIRVRDGAKLRAMVDFSG